MAIDESQLEKKYALTKINILSSTSISAKTTNITSKLTLEGNDKPALVSLTARSTNANKLISVVEIAKRNLTSRNVRIFQYNALSSQMIDIPRDSRRKGDGQTADGDKEDDSDDAFETLSVPLDAVKKRNVPVLIIYLATMSIKELKAEYGEQK